MKIEIVTHPSPHIINLSTTPMVIPLGSVIVAEALGYGQPSPAKYILMHTEKGYIFQYWDCACGHSGWSATAAQAITSAVQAIPNTKVYMYPTLKEAIEEFFTT